MTIRVILADDHKILIDTLSLLLENEKDIKVVGTATDGNALLKLFSTLDPDVVVMDVDMPGMGGIEASRQLIAKHPKIKIVALSAHSQKQHVLGMMDAGAFAYVIKGNAVGELLRPVRAVVQGQKYLFSEVASVVIDNVGHTHTDGIIQLGRREREVLQHLAEGCSSPEIAKRLFISTSTVDVHRRNIMKKLDLHSVAELTKYAIHQGLTSDS
jgi:two-component system NarL family response regulator